MLAMAHRPEAAEERVQADVDDQGAERGDEHRHPSLLALWLPDRTSAATLAADVRPGLVARMRPPVSGRVG